MNPAARGRRTRLLALAGIATGALVLVDLVIRTYHEYGEPMPRLRWLFNVGVEGNLATWWNSALLLSVAGMALVAAVLSGPGRTPGRLSWLALAGVGMWFSLDESVEIHERLMGPGKTWARELGIDLPTYAWVLPGAVLASAAVVAAVLWARRFPKDLRRGLLGALAVYFGGALGVESLNGWFYHQGAEAADMIGTSLEEGMEMGACLLAAAVIGRYVLLRHDPSTGALTLRLREDAPAPTAAREAAAQIAARA